MNILTQTNQQVDDIKPHEPMVFPDMAAAVIYMMHNYITNFDYEIDIPTRGDAVFSLIDANKQFKVELLSNDKVLEFGGAYEEYTTKQEVLDFYAMSAAITKAHKEKIIADNFNNFLKDINSIAIEKNSRSKKMTKTYFILNTETKLIKIGKSIRPSQRLKDIQGMAGAKLEMLAVIDKNIESELHIYFKKYRRTGEWFDDKDGLISKLIESIKSEVAQ